MGGQQMRMLSGFNHNIRFRGKVYHVQTEDGGKDNPQIITHAFQGGAILHRSDDAEEPRGGGTAGSPGPEPRGTERAAVGAEQDGGLERRDRDGGVAVVQTVSHGGRSLAQAQAAGSRVCSAPEQCGVARQREPQRSARIGAPKADGVQGESEGGLFRGSDQAPKQGVDGGAVRQPQGLGDTLQARPDRAGQRGFENLQPVGALRRKDGHPGNEGSLHLTSLRQRQT